MRATRRSNRKRHTTSLSSLLRDDDRLYQRRFAWLGGIVLTIGALLYVFQPPPRDKLTNCVLGEQPLTHFVVVDKTDRWSDETGELLKKRILGMKTEILKNERLVIFEMGPDVQSSIIPRFSICNPGSDLDYNFIFEGERAARRKYINKFGEPLEALVDQLKQPREARTTPLAEVLGKISGKPEFWGKVKNINVFSDMRQNTKRHSVFPKAGRNALNVDRFTNYLRELIDERYIGKEINLVFVENDTSIKRPTEAQLQKFWTESLSRIGAKTTWRVN